MKKSIVVIIGILIIVISIITIKNSPSDTTILLQLHQMKKKIQP